MIYDTNDNRLLTSQFALYSGAVETLPIKIACLAGYHLASEPIAGVTVEAKASGDVSWTDIETTPYLLTPFDGTTEDFSVRLTGETYSLASRVLIPIQVGIIKPPVILSATATVLSDTEIRINWVKSGMAVSGFEVRVDGGSAVDQGFVTEALYILLTPATEYLFEVRAYNVNAQYSEWFPVTATTNA